jgi:hypothetical protein
MIEDRKPWPFPSSTTVPLRELEKDVEIETLHAENKRLRAALDKIAERTGSDDPCRALVELAREALR